MKKILLLSFLTLALPSFCSASIHYTRTPAEDIISNPVEFDLSFDAYEDLGFNPVLNCNGIGLYISGEDNEHNPIDYFTGILTPISTGTPYSWLETMPIGVYGDNVLICYDNGNQNGQGEKLENGDIGEGFEVVLTPPAPARATMLTIPAGLATSALAQVSELVFDYRVVLYLLIAFLLLPLAIDLVFWIVYKTPFNKDK